MPSTQWFLKFYKSIILDMSWKKYAFFRKFWTPFQKIDKALRIGNWRGDRGEWQTGRKALANISISFEWPLPKNAEKKSCQHCLDKWWLKGGQVNKSSRLQLRVSPSLNFCTFHPASSMSYKNFGREVWLLYFNFPACLINYLHCRRLLTPLVLV